jgi:hypothetical protein
MALLTETQEALVALMSDISEEAYYASWMEDLEFVLWYAVLHGPFSYGRTFIDEQLIEQLAQLSKQTEGWIVFKDETWETPIVQAEWIELFRSTNPERYLKYVEKP